MPNHLHLLNLAKARDDAAMIVTPNCRLSRERRELQKSKCGFLPVLSRVFSIVFTISCLAAPATRGESISGSATVTGGGTVSFSGDNIETNWVTNADGGRDFLIKFLPGSTPSSLEFSGATLARFLAVGGGGGAGGTYDSATSGGYDGGSGGGGGGAMREVNAMFQKGKFEINPGRGGAAARIVDDRDNITAGEDGWPTAVFTNGVAMLKVAGGGAGGGECAGNPGSGGSGGGGGSMYRKSKSEGTEKPGGDGESGGGFNGGAGNIGNFGGGGAGAGGAGAAADAAGGGIGGIGRASDIEVDYGTPEENWPWYAGGGAGGNNDKKTTLTAAIEGGRGGGGKGGVGDGVAKPENGVDGTGGGGGGASYSEVGGKGGSGVVVIRISSAMKGEFKKPEPTKVVEYDREEHNVIEPSIFYTVSEPNVGTNAGTYTATATLRDGVTWPDGTDDPAIVTMRITRCEVAFSGLHLDGWTYGTDEKDVPQPTCTVDPEWVTPNYEWRIANGESGGWKNWNEEKPENAGGYELRVGAPTDGNYEFDYATTAFAITKAQVTFSNVKQKDWMYGTPDEATPRPIFTIAPEKFRWEVVFEYKARTKDKGEDEGEEGWSGELPKEVGSYWLRLRMPDRDNYDYAYAYAAFRIVNGLGDKFVDYVEITNLVYTGGAPLTNFPVRISLAENVPVKGSLAEKGLPGFLYSRAGEDDGRSLAFTDADGNVLAYTQADERDWNAKGESFVYVRIPELSSEPRLIRLYWKLRDGQTVPAHDPDSVFKAYDKTTANTMQGDVDYGFDLVVRDGYRVNFWKVPPTFDPPERTVWNEGEAPSEIIPPVIADGSFVQLFYDTVSGQPLTEMPTKGGAYRVSFELVDLNLEYEPLECHRDFCIMGSHSFSDLKGGAKSVTLSGRVMLANSDDEPGFEVTDQCYWQTNPDEYNVWWAHEGTHGVTAHYPNMRAYQGITHTLHYRDEAGNTNALWRFENVVIGNASSQNGPEEGKIILPHSPTQKALSSPTVDGNKYTESSWMVLRNTTTAIINSPCYTNGIGTIYFDAINVRSPAFCKPEYSHIVVEVVTNVTDEVNHKNYPPTDEYLAKYGKDSDWTNYVVSATVLKRDKNTETFEDLGKQHEVALSIEQDWSDKNFYRLVVPLDYREPARFRIRRATSDTEHPNLDYYTSFLAVDNIVVSYPKSSVDLAPCGQVDPAKTGRQLVGQEGAFNIAFPSVKDNEVYGRATNVVYVSAATNANPKSLAQLTKMHYRWRYLNQRFKYREEGRGKREEGEWFECDLSPFDDYRASVKLDPKVLEEEGDIEFFFETFTGIPYYRYHDYSGSGAELGGLYTEETGVITNRMDAAAEKDWFVRLRAGRSDWSGINVQMDGAVKSSTPMELVGDHLWRGMVKIPTNASGSATFFFDGLGRYEEWGVRPVGAKQWMSKSDIDQLPGRGETVVGGRKKTIQVDGASGYLEFQFNDETGVFTVGHAEYQTFNAWHDAYLAGETFVGTYAETSGVSTAEMVQTNAHMNTWSLFQSTSANWNEDFTLPNYETPTYPKYTSDYISHKMPHLWQGENGLFVDAQICARTSRTNDSGLAWQLAGEGGGNVSYTERDVPNGLDTLTFKARLAQGIGWYDFAYWGGGTAMRNYTFGFPAVISTASGTDCAPNASVSVVGYYFPGRGCYEARVERKATDGVQLSIHKWTVSSGKVRGECVGTLWIASKDILQHDGSQKNSVTESNPWMPKAWHLFISCGDEKSDDGRTTGTAIVAGLSSALNDPSGTFSGAKHYAIRCFDAEANRLTKGSFGALSANCNGQFANPRHWTAPLAKGDVTWTVPSKPTADDRLLTGTAGTGKNESGVAITFNGSMTDDGGTLRDDEWGVQPGRGEVKKYERSAAQGGNLYGLGALADLRQTVDVYLKSATAGGAGWVLRESKVVSDYKFASYTVTVRTNESVHVKLQSGADATDVTVWDIAQTAWNGQDIPGIDGLSSDFIYTQAKVTEEKSENVTNRVCTLQPARANPGKALSIRSPILKGLGMMGFSYKNLKPGCRLLVQVATNDVRGNLSGTLGYNYSTNAVGPGEGQVPPTWITVREFGYDELARGDNQTHYLGWHTHRDDPLEGVMRLAVAPDVVRNAAGKAKADPDWGSVTITDIYVHDEPAIDERSWLGFNFRVLGDATDSERRMLLSDTAVAKTADEVGTGLSAGLNNSLQQVKGDDPSEYNRVNPCVQSPTFGRYATTNGIVKQASIGRVRFRARLYETNTTATLSPATVTLYGVTDGAATDWGEPLTNFTLSSQVYEIKEYVAPAQRSFSAIRLMVDGVIDKPPKPGVRRVLLDEIVVSEKTDSAVGFVYARPFRTGLENDAVIANIRDKDQQPMSGESWGVQTQLRLDQLGDDIDVDRGFRVTLRTFKGTSPWGYDRWLKDPSASEEVDLVQVGAKKDWIFRSTGSDPRTVVKPDDAANTIVQYVVTVYYYLRGSSAELSATIGDSEVEGVEWTNPTWYEPVDKNDEYGDAHAHFSPYTILETIAPGRAWINEVNYNDGPRAQTGGALAPTNQFIEIAVPWGVDMTGWKVVLTDMNAKSVDLAILGQNGVASMKKSEYGHVGDYDFLVLQSPRTRDAGGIRGEDGHPAADGTWSPNPAMGSTFISGSLSYEMPYQIELVRPSGIVEHQFTLEGTNETKEVWEDYIDYGFAYDGTNLLAELDFAFPSPKRFFAGGDNARKVSNPSVYSSLGVVGAAHGEEKAGEAPGWSGDMRFTPGRINEGQSEEAFFGWYVRPIGESVWVYARLDGDHLHQQIGSDTNRDTYVILRRNGTTNIAYTVDNWYQVDAVDVIVGKTTNRYPLAEKRGCTFTVSSVTDTTYVVAHEGISQDLIDIGLDPRDRYTKAVMKWLERGVTRDAAGNEVPFANPEGPITNAIFRGFSAGATNCVIGLKGMYWFDIDPTDPGWWLRGDTVDIIPTVRRRRKWNEEQETIYTNMQIRVKLYLSNDVSQVVHAPYRLQGMGGERSDAFTGNWTGETFKVEGYLFNGEPDNVGWLPLRWFTFYPGSFGEDWTTLIEILDPFSPQSPGHTYGWDSYSGRTVGLRWNVTEAQKPTTVERLEKESVYDKPPYEPVE